MAGFSAVVVVVRHRVRVVGPDVGFCAAVRHCGQAFGSLVGSLHHFSGGAIMSRFVIATESTNVGWQDAVQWAGAFVASFRSPDTRKAYQRDLSCWFTSCATHDLHPYHGIRRTHVEVYVRQLEQQVPPLPTRRCGGGSRR
jgi:hypothetical protein